MHNLLHRLRQIVHYNPVTGVFTRCVSVRGSKAGTILNGRNAHGYVQMTIDGQFYYGHRLAWFMTFGLWPKIDIDHQNRDPGDNRIVNLREATKSQNLANSKCPRHNLVGLKGASAYGRHGRFRSMIIREKKRIYLGTFATAEAAHAAYVEAAQKYSGEFARAA